MVSGRVRSMVPGLLLALLVLGFAGGMGLLAWRDHQAVRRCHRLGGQTYDSGAHCTIGGRTVSTR